MKLFRSTTIAILIVTLNAVSLTACAHPASSPPRKPVIQLAILLDTSNSMDGLIDQARTQLWRVVNEFGRARKSGVMPELQVALYEYGNDSLAAEGGHIRMVLPFTTDLDRISEELFALQTNGGQEYCGAVIGEAVRGLQWSASPDDLKVIFIAGNEEFTQGAVDFRASCATALRRGIIVNTIFCGDRAQGLETKWGVGATIADGRFVAIDQNVEIAELETPQDAAIAALGLKLNDTYVAYGVKGSDSAKRQSKQDQNIAAKASANVERQLAKASANYYNGSWDLVDAKKSGVTVEKLKTAELPPEMRKMTIAQRKAHVDGMAKRRADLQTQIARLDAERKKYIAMRRKDVPAAANTLDEAILGAVREAGRKRGFTFA